MNSKAYLDFYEFAKKEIDKHVQSLKSNIKLIGTGEDGLEQARLSLLITSDINNILHKNESIMLLDYFNRADKDKTKAQIEKEAYKQVFEKNRLDLFISKEEIELIDSLQSTLKERA